MTNSDGTGKTDVTSVGFYVDIQPVTVVGRQPAWLFSAHEIMNPGPHASPQDGEFLRARELSGPNIQHDLKIWVESFVPGERASREVIENVLRRIGLMLETEGVISVDNGHYRLFIFPPTVNRPDWMVRCLAREEKNSEFFFEVATARQTSDHAWTRSQLAAILDNAYIDHDDMTELLDLLDSAG